MFCSKLDTMSAMAGQDRPERGKVFVGGCAVDFCHAEEVEIGVSARCIGIVSWDGNRGTEAERREGIVSLAVGRQIRRADWDSKN